MTQEQKEKFKNNNHKRNICGTKRKSHFNLGFISIFMLIMIIFVTFSYVLVKNDLSIKGFVINDLQKQIKNLETEKEKLEFSVMEIESYNNLTKRIENLGMVKVDKIEYINPGDYSVAKR